ncbi:MAG: ribonuclease P protein component [Gammaproteobacteria bacterium]|nr:ribonuclease P protein component [Gammaproteobacteria bacterium]
MKYTFPRKIRLLTDPQFKQVFKKTKRKIHTQAFIIYYCDNDLSYPRLGVIVPKRNIHQATKRNRFKRVVRESFRLNQNRFQGVDILIVGKKNAENFLGKELNSLMIDGLNKVEQNYA